MLLPGFLPVNVSNVPANWLSLWIVAGAKFVLVGSIFSDERPEDALDTFF
jgi:hypothetical protein